MMQNMKNAYVKSNIIKNKTNRALIVQIKAYTKMESVNVYLITISRMEPV